MIGFFASFPTRFAAVGALALTLVACSSGDDAGKHKRPPMTVRATAATAVDFAPRLVALGTVTPLQTVAVRPRTDGQITAILFQEGDNVRAGQPLFRLDDRAARAALAQSRATLASARAAAIQARGDYARAEALVGKGFISKAVLDQRQALAGSAEATIAGAQASVASAETLLSYLTITAPVSGRSGELHFRVGATVHPGDALPLVTINQLSPISVRFLVPSESVQAVRTAMAAGPLSVAARPEGSAGTAAPAIATGKLAFLDNNVDPGNGGVTAKAEFTNADATLWPGAVINVVLPLGAAVPRIALPEAAVQTGRDWPFVWAIRPDGAVAMREVGVAGRADGKVYIASGIMPGERIVTDALIKLKPGDKVRVKDGGPGKPPRAALNAAPAAVGG